MFPIHLGQLETYIKCPTNTNCYIIFIHVDEIHEPNKLVEHLTNSTPFKCLTKNCFVHYETMMLNEKHLNVNELLNLQPTLEIDYMMVMNMETLFYDRDIISNLINKEKVFVAPLLSCSKRIDSFNFLMDDEEKMQNFSQCQKQEKCTGCASASSISNTFMINLNLFNNQIRNWNGRTSQQLPTDFINHLVHWQTKEFGISSKWIKIFDEKYFFSKLYICNRKEYGLQFSYDLLRSDYELLSVSVDELVVHHQLEYMVNRYDKKLWEAASRSRFPEEDFKRIFGILNNVMELYNFNKFFDKIFVINLKRRNEKRERMKESLSILNIDVEWIDAIDGKNMTDDDMKNIKFFDSYIDPYNERKMNKAEVGCFLSHHLIWDRMVNENMKNVLIFEDDVRFAEYFSKHLNSLIQLLSTSNKHWNLIYLGRKIMRPDEENFDEDFPLYLIHPAFSHWTLGYMLNLEGAIKLTKQKPLEWLIPVDEYLPLMMNKPYDYTWSEEIQSKDVIGLSINPLVIEPTHYYGEPGYISDTENFYFPTL
ncbi:hypothetical protein SNEBB_004190 [Seison nebaliae]|nr:hypothetical protein SNEBB_004190 [Seison nebaliae]